MVTCRPSGFTNLLASESIFSNLIHSTQTLMLSLYYHFRIDLIAGFSDLAVQLFMMFVSRFTVIKSYHCRGSIQMTSANEKDVIVFSVVKEMCSPFGTIQAADNYRAP